MATDSQPTQQDSQGIRVAGWRISTRHGAKLSPSDGAELAKKLCVAAACTVQAPAGITPSEVEMVHEASGFWLRFGL